VVVEVVVVVVVEVNDDVESLSRLMVDDASPLFFPLAVVEMFKAWVRSACVSLVVGDICVCVVESRDL